MAGYAAKNSEKIIDYYVYYSLNRNDSTEAIKNKLGAELSDKRARRSSADKKDQGYNPERDIEIKKLEEAKKCFRNDARRKEYDKKLDAAYKAGMVDVPAKSIPRDFFEQLHDMFEKGNYNGVINTCQQAVADNIRDCNIYLFMAQSYMALNDSENCYNTIGWGLNAFPDNMELLQEGARLSNTGANDYNISQTYINRMMAIDPENRYANSEQCFLYECTDREDLAYQLMDSYIQKYPNDIEFRRQCANDLVTRSYGRYSEDPATGDWLLASQEAYDKCLSDCSKAVSVYSDDYTNNAYEDVKFYGTTEFNKDNLESIAWMFGTGLVYCACGFIALAGGPLGFIGLEAVAALVLFCAIRLKQVSTRPYWQINKYYLTGQREPAEKRYILIGNIFTGYIKWSIRISIEVTKWVMRLAFHFG